MDSRHLKPAWYDVGFAHVLLPGHLKTSPGSIPFLFQEHLLKIELLAGDNQYACANCNCKVCIQNLLSLLPSVLTTEIEHG